MLIILLYQYALRASCTDLEIANKIRELCSWLQQVMKVFCGSLVIIFKDTRPDS